MTRFTLLNKCGERFLSEPWIGVTKFTILNKCLPKGFSWVGPRWTKKQDTRRPERIWLEHWSTLSKGSQREAIYSWVHEKPRLKAARAQRMMHSIPSDDQKFDGIMTNAGRKLERRSRTFETSLRTEKTCSEYTKKTFYECMRLYPEESTECTMRDKGLQRHVESQRICREVTKIENIKITVTLRDLDGLMSSQKLRTRQEIPESQRSRCTKRRRCS